MRYESKLLDFVNNAKSSEKAYKKIDKLATFDAKLVYHSVTEGLIRRIDAGRLIDRQPVMNPEEKAEALKKVVFDYYDALEKQLQESSSISIIWWKFKHR